IRNLLLHHHWVRLQDFHLNRLQDINLVRLIDWDLHLIRHLLVDGVRFRYGYLLLDGNWNRYRHLHLIRHLLLNNVRLWHVNLHLVRLVDWVLHLVRDLLVDGVGLRDVDSILDV
uniref:Uncharacterized protein n=1 Tax=Anopheles christyi TaxID=43041 RepID=A0A182KJ27_9DIPT